MFTSCKRCDVIIISSDAVRGLWEIRFGESGQQSYFVNNSDVRKVSSRHSIHVILNFMPWVVTKIYKNVSIKSYLSRAMQF